MNTYPLKLLAPVALGAAIWFSPVPDGIAINAWHLLGIFVASIFAIIIKSLPIGAIAIISMAVVAMTGVTSDNPSQAIKDSLSMFSSPLIWLIGFAIMISRALIKTGLGARIAYYFVSLFGKRTLGIAYSLSLSELLIAPITPSNTARGGGVIHPIMRSIAETFNSKPNDQSASKIGTYLALVNFNANPITSGMFITATAPNPLVVNFVAELTGSSIHLSWTTWALAMLLPGLVCLLLMPLVIYLLSPPEIKKTPNAAEFAKENLHKMGTLKQGEWIMLGVFVFLLLFWAGVPALILGPAFKLHSATTALMGVGLLLATKVLSWDDILGEKQAWDTVVWFSALIMMASFLNKLGLIPAVAQMIESSFAAMHLGVYWSVALLVLIYVYMHYFFASTTAHVTAVFAAFYGAGLSLGADPMLLALIMAAAGNIMMGLTHYATGTAPVIFNSGYVGLGKWWGVGFIVSVINLVVWVGLGLIWWKVLGYY